MLKEKLQQCCWSWIRLLLITTNCSSLENHVHEGWTKFGGSEPGQVTHCLFMAAAYSKVIKEAHLLGLQSSASLPAEEGRNYMSSPFSHHLAGLWGKMFKRLSLRLIYDLSNDSWYCNETPPFTCMQIHLCQWISAGALVSLCRDFIARLCFKCSDLFPQIKKAAMAKQMEYFNRIKQIRIYLSEITPGSVVAGLGDVVHGFFSASFSDFSCMKCYQST